MSEAGADEEALRNVGTLLAVVGASGVGKDSLIAHARREFSGNGSVLFVRRIVTRPPLAAAEDHDHLTHDEFAKALAAGRFAVH
ncbi:MAG: phosphonate metabolism protein/1,5-bisphosphokinase (PRPP-forming) PhnN, partial [Rhizobiales bacterium]|nr:phosphonate metabolism protein/1,5-bisphosphokinase (PRPP-forming) PhnN [Hyphomicrobiales bacterium]